MSFPEEPLNRPPSEGGGHYPAAVHQKLNGEQYQIVRKLGYGSRSSTWLVERARDNEYFAVKIMTVAASEQAKTIELPIFKSVASIRDNILPVFYGSFWEQSGAGSHLCIAMNPLSTSVHSLQLDAEYQRLPVHAVQRIVFTVVEALRALHDIDIMHGAENIVFSTATQAEFLKSRLDSEPAPATTMIKKYLAVRSQPLTHNFRWKDKSRRVADWPIYVNNFGHAQRRNYKPEKNFDYLSAPETLLHDASCSPKTDIWMLGCMTFHLLTGSLPFSINMGVHKRIATICAILEDEVPLAWLSDKKMKGYNATAHGFFTSIEASLSHLHKDDAGASTAFIKACLRLDPNKRLSATELSRDRWLTRADALAVHERCDADEWI